MGKTDYLPNRPHMTTQSSFQRRSDPQRLMHAPKVVVHVEERNHRDVIVQLLAERVREAREASHIHPHIEILPFHVASRDVLFGRIAYNFDSLGPKTLCGAVAFLPFRIVAVNLLQLSEVDLAAEATSSF